MWGRPKSPWSRSDPGGRSQAGPRVDVGGAVTWPEEVGGLWDKLGWGWGVTGRFLPHATSTQSCLGKSVCHVQTGSHRSRVASPLRPQDIAPSSGPCSAAAAAVRTRSCKHCPLVARLVNCAQVHSRAAAVFGTGDGENAA